MKVIILSEERRRQKDETEQTQSFAVLDELMDGSFVCVGPVGR